MPESGPRGEMRRPPPGRGPACQVLIDQPPDHGGIRLVDTVVHMDAFAEARFAISASKAGTRSSLISTATSTSGSLARAMRAQLPPW
jgi:hypothetical protein